MFLWFYRPEKIIEEIGVTNGYILTFILAFLGGFATITAASAYPAVVTLAIGGLNPLMLGIIAAVGITIADMIFYYFGQKGRDLADEHPKFDKITKSMLKWVHKQPKWIIPFFIWVYVGLTPFPNNALTFSGGIIEYKFRKVLIPDFLGNLTLMLILAYIGAA